MSEVTPANSKTHRSEVHRAYPVQADSKQEEPILQSVYSNGFWLEYSSLYGSVVRVWDEISIDKFGVFLLLLSSTYTELRSSLLLAPPKQ